MSEKVNTKGLNDRERLAIEELSRDLRANKFVNGQMQFTDITNRDYFLKAYGDSILYCITWNKFLVWNGTSWDVDTRGRVAERSHKQTLLQHAHRLSCHHQK